MNTNEYTEWLQKIKSRIVKTQIQSTLAANSELIRLYWDLGQEIEEKQKYTEWGKGFLDAFSKDLRKSFPEVKGFSAKNLRYCRAFYRFYSESTKWQQLVAKIQLLPSQNSSDIKIDNYKPVLIDNIP